MKFVSCDVVRAALLGGTPLKLEGDTLVVKSSQLTFPNGKIWFGRSLVPGAPAYLVNAGLGVVRSAKERGEFAAVLGTPGWMPCGVIRVVGFRVDDLKHSGTGRARFDKFGFILGADGTWFQATEDHKSKMPSESEYWLLLGIKNGHANVQEGSFKVAPVVMDGFATSEKISDWCKRILKKASLR